MSLPEILVPSGVPAFRADGHSYERATVYADVPRGTGHGRKRRRSTTATATVSISIRMNAAAMLTFDAWFENTLQVGVRPFAARLFGIGTSAPQWWSATWLAPYKADPISGGFWVVTGQLLLTGDASDAAPPISSAAVEFAAALVATAQFEASTDASVEFSAALGVLMVTGAAIEFSAGLTASAMIAVPMLGSVEFSAALTASGTVYTPGANTTFLQFACSDETSSIGVARVLRLSVVQPIKIATVLATLNVAQASGTLFTVDLRKNGTSMLSTLITIDNGAVTSASATTPPVITSNTLAYGDVLTVHVTQIGDGAAAGLKIGLSGVPPP